MEVKCENWGKWIKNEGNMMIFFKLKSTLNLNFYKNKI